MEEEKAAAYYDELSRKGEGAARFKQGLGFSSASSNEPVPSRGSALVSSSSFLSSFVRASSPSKTTTDFQKQAQLESIQNKLKKKPKDDQNQGKSVSSRVSNVKDIDRHSRHRYRSESRSRSPKHSRRRSRSRSPERNSKRRSRSRSRERGKDRQLRRRSRSRSRNRDAKRRYRSKSRSRSRDRDRYREKEKQRRRRSRSVSAEDRGRKKDQRSDKVGKDRIAVVDYTKLIGGYEDMTPAERVKAKMKLQLSETAQKDETKGMGSGWERFDFDKDAPLDDEQIEAAEDDTALVKHIGKSFRFSAVETRREEQIKAAHDEAIFGGPSHPTLPPSTETDDEAEEGNGEKVTFESAPVSSLISGQVLSMQQGSWRDRARRS